MSIVTKKGDQGLTALMYNRQVPKTDPRVEAYGCVDELNSALGLARATACDESIRTHLLARQRDLVILMGELATAPEDLPRFLKDGFTQVTSALTDNVEQLIKTLEARGLSFPGWATPGATLHAAALDHARAVARRAERRACGLQETGKLQNPEIIIYLNRLSDALWLLARWVEHEATRPPTPRQDQPGSGDATAPQDDVHAGS